MSRNRQYGPEILLYVLSALAAIGLCLLALAAIEGLL